MIQIAYPLSFGEVYRREVRTAPNVRTILHANVLRLNTDPSGTSVTDVDVSTMSKHQWKVRARAFVLATGGIEVPRLLLASNAVRPKGIGNENDLVGRYFMEHIDVEAGFALLTTPAKALDLYTGFVRDVPEDRIPGRTFGVKGSHILAESTLTREGLLGAEITLAVAASGGRNSPRQSQGINDRDVLELSKALAGTRWPTIAYVRILAEQSPEPDSRVTLGDTRDALGMPRVELDWRVTGDQRRSIRRAAAIFANELGRAGVGRFQVGIGGTSHIIGADLHFSGFRVEPEKFDAEDFPVGVGYHHMGTARMHTDPQRGVVDEHCRVHSTTNLFIGGSAVFPTSGTSTPTFTIVALALRLADHLQREVLA
jgi:choline dehydrogenase-like flavoprotein